MDIDPNYKRNRVILYLIVVIIIVLYGLYHYDFFNQSSSVNPKLEDAIKLGREYSYAIFTNQPRMLTRDGDSLYKISIGKAKEKIQNLSGDQNWRLEAIRLYKNKDTTERFKHLEIYGVNEYNLKLNALVRHDSYVNLQFVYHEFPIGIGEREECILCRNIGIPNKEDLTEIMSYFITTRYELYTDDRIGAIVLDKFLNFTPNRFVYTSLSYIFRLLGNCLEGSCGVFETIPHFLYSPYSNTRGHWVVYDYDYNYNLTDYYDWLSKQNPGSIQH